MNLLLVCRPFTIDLTERISRQDCRHATEKTTSSTKLHLCFCEGYCAIVVSTSWGSHWTGLWNLVSLVFRSDPFVRSIEILLKSRQASSTWLYIEERFANPRVWKDWQRRFSSLNAIPHFTTLRRSFDVKRDASLFVSDLSLPSSFRGPVSNKNVFQRTLRYYFLLVYRLRYR